MEHLEEGKLYIITNTISSFLGATSSEDASEVLNMCCVARKNERRYTDRFRSRLFGFFFGSTLTGAGIYYYVLDEYKLSNELLTEDIYVSSTMPLRSII